jgi:hypothetical protein
MNPSITKMNPINKQIHLINETIYLDTRPNNIRHATRQAMPCMLTMTTTIGDQPPLQ